jgi:hypothetical protein
LAGGRYRLVGLLGEGGMARVFDAFDERLERPVAVKILRPETQVLPGMRDRFQQEANIAARLSHPNIVSVLDYGEDHWSSFLVMERLPGTTLRDEISRGPLADHRVHLVAAETLAALAAAHTFGVLHRDVKPSNILLQADGHTKITDFGIAKSIKARTDVHRLTDDGTTAGFVLGTPGYLAPERRSGRPATVQTDLYSVGAVMVETLTGQRFGYGSVPTEGIPPSLRAIACRALAADPQDRFSCADEMLHALRHWADPVTRRAQPRPAAVAAAGAPVTRPLAPGTAVRDLPSAEGPRADHPRRWRHRIILAGMALATIVVALVLLLATGSQPTGPASTAPPRDVAVSRPHQAGGEAAAITSLATSLAGGGFPGDRAMADALDATAAQPPGVGRQSSARQALALAQVLLDGGGITSGQYQDVANVLQATGTVTTTPITALTPPLPGSLFHGHGHGPGYGRGDQG